MKNVFRIYIPFLLYLATNSIIRILLPKRESVLHLWVLLPWLRPTAEDVSAFGQHRKFPPHARKTTGTEGKGVLRTAIYNDILNLKRHDNIKSLKTRTKNKVKTCWIYSSANFEP